MNLDSTALRLGDQVTLHYRLSCQDEILVDTFTEGPETFTLGHGEIDARLESLLLGLRVGDHPLFELPPGDAFGPHDPTMIYLLPRNDFPGDMELAVNSGVDFTLPNGQSVTGSVLEIDADEVRVDFNHPLAGLPVNFEVRILAITPK
ncbi:MAG: FKBP-type peptidyl-prolyl cis-trans isomerase [Pseudomonadota bacterium]|nr:FKBP-type peptidyl-prolyl cis-trans isomerase [Pseudomonadota bacterium]MDP1904556.1 FKBP-type peptidyl-prolyl cis-trans isomerase [Pseudomonadota bacterium]MDP2353245.1 FKBP-type peptidyl-prolyl cis-trans isomerase [Pseudomonadota bacterium]